MDDLIIPEEALVLTSIRNLLHEAVRWTTKKGYTVHKIVVQENNDMAETKSLNDLIHDFESGRTSWPAPSNDPCVGPEEDAEVAAGERHLTTLKYVAQLSDKLLKACAREGVSLSRDDMADLEEKRGHFMPRRVKQELCQEEEPMLSKDLVQFLNELDENDVEEQEAGGGDEVAAGGSAKENDSQNNQQIPEIKMELGDVFKGGDCEGTTNNGAVGEKKKGKRRVRGRADGAARKVEPRKENMFIKYKCFECETRPDLGDKKSLRAHWEATHVVDADVGEPKIRCRLCQKNFSVNNNAAGFHQQQQAAGANPPPPPAAVQRVSWDVICAYLIHLVVNHAEEMPAWVRSFRCEATGCKFVALDEFGLECHQKLMRYDCAQCGMHFAKKQRRTSHVMSRHSDRAPEGRSKRLNYAQYKCYICTLTRENADTCEIFPDTDALTDHVRESHTGKTEFKGESRDYLQCTVCLKQIILEPRKANNYMISRGLAALLHHMVSIHQVPIPSFIEPVKCPGCPILFVHMEALLAHSRSHVDKTTGLAKRSQCYKCGKFIKVSALNCHLRICQVPLEARANFACPVCNEIFMTRSGMTRHLKANHTGENNFLCHLCTNVYKSKYALQYHMHRAHQFRAPGAEVFYCQVQSCSYSSILASDVKKHEMRVHNIGEPPAECNICGKKVKKRYLKKHQSLHNKPLKQAVPSLPKHLHQGHAGHPGMGVADVLDLVPICGTDVPAAGEIEVESHSVHQAPPHHPQQQHLQHMPHHQVAVSHQQMAHAQGLPMHNQVDPTGSLGRIGLQVVYNHYMN